MDTRCELAMKAVILAGGEGKRLLPYTTTFPKPTMPVGNRPILELILRQLSAHGIKEIVVPTGYLEELIRGDLRERVFLMNGDILTDIDFRQFVEDHCAGGS